MAKAGDAYNAVTVLQDLLKEFESTKESNTKMGRVGGVGVGALLGSFLLPGVGTIIGSAIGGLLGDALGISETRVSAFAAETHYRLGVIYEMLHNPAALHHYMQARALDTSHALAATALTRLQPTTPVSPQLTALDDDF